MKYILILSIIAASLGSCVIVPAGYGDNRDGYYYNHNGYRDREYNRGDGNYRDYGYRGNQGYTYRDHGS